MMTQSVKEQLKGHLAAFSASVIWGVNIVITKSLLSSSWVTPMGYTITRLSFAMLTLWIVGMFHKKEKIDRRDFPVVFLCAMLGIAITQTLYTVGIKFTTPVIWSLVQSSNTFVVMILSLIFFKDRITPLKTLGVMLGISGSGLIILKSGSLGASSGNAIGAIIALVCVFCQSFNVLLTKRNTRKYTPLALTRWMFLFSWAVILPFGIREIPSQRIYSPEITPSAFLRLGIALIFFVIAFFLGPVALKRLKPTTSNMYSNLQPLSASVASIMVGQDVFTWDKLAAMLLVATGVFLVTRNTVKE
jgi:drug/metabolite transporter (DMT)-like permease